MFKLFFARHRNLVFGFSFQAVSRLAFLFDEIKVKKSSIGKLRSESFVLIFKAN